ALRSTRSTCASPGSTRAWRRTSPPLPTRLPASRTRLRSRGAGPGRNPPPGFWSAAAGFRPTYAELMGHGVHGIGLPSADKVREWLRAAAADPESLPDEGYETLLGADGRPLADLCELADSLRQQAVGGALTYVVNRNLDTSAVAGADPRSRERLAAL